MKSKECSYCVGIGSSFSTNIRCELIGDGMVVEEMTGSCIVFDSNGSTLNTDPYVGEQWGEIDFNCVAGTHVIIFFERFELGVNLSEFNEIRRLACRIRSLLDSVSEIHGEMGDIADICTFEGVNLFKSLGEMRIGAV